MVNDADLVASVQRIIDQGDISQLTIKLIIQQLTEEFKCDLSDKKKFLRQTIDSILEKKQEENNTTEDGNGNGENEKVKEKKVKKADQPKEENGHSNGDSSDVKPEVPSGIESKFICSLFRIIINNWLIHCFLACS